jgi:S-adenosylmethionine:diacylglycerol 3-amino-3-carboxypropyl transferase
VSAALDSTDTARPATIAGRAAFDFIRYASVWEDADVLCEALAPVARGGRVLSIASAGDNALALLTLDPAEVVAADLSAAQIACLELRIVAFRQIGEHDRLLTFLGAGTGPDVVRPERLAFYDAHRGELSGESAAFWDAHRDSIVRGVIHAGKFERYFHLFRRRVLPWIHSSRTIAELLEPRTNDERDRFYRTRWNTWRWRSLFRVFFSRWVMGRLGRDPAFFAQVEGSVSDRILARTRHALTRLPTESNPYLAYILTGTFPPEALPRYLRPEHHATIRDRLDRIRPIRAPIEAAAEGPLDAMNLSDVFEYMTPAEHERSYAALIERARPGARLAYWNMLAPRARPASLAIRVHALEPLAGELHLRDRAWFYSRFHVDEVAGGSAPTARDHGGASA